MAITKTYSVLLAPTSVAQGSIKTAPNQVSSTADLRTALGATITATILNGNPAPVAPGALTIQISGDGTTWRDFATVGGDTVASSSYSWSIPLGLSPMYARGIAYGNTTNPVTASFEIEVTAEA